MEASTIIPMATVIPARVRRLIVLPERYMAPKAKRTDTGMDRPTMMVARTSCKKKRIIRVARRVPTSAEMMTVLIDRLVISRWSETVRQLNTPGFSLEIWSRTV